MTEAATAPAASESGRSNLTGITMFLAGTAAFVGNDSITKLIGESLPAGELVAMRGAVVAVLVLIAGLATGAFRGPIWSRLTPLFCLRPLFDLGATITFVVSLMHMRFADAVGIQQVQPLLVTAASGLLLGEHVGWRRWLATLVGFAGVLLIIRPGTGAFEPFALMAIACTVFVAMSDLSTRVVAQGVPALFLALPSAVVVSLGGCALGLTETWVMPSAMVMLGLAVTGALIVAAVVLIIAAIRISELSVLAPLRYVGVLLAVVLQIVLWGVVARCLDQRRPGAGGRGGALHHPPRTGACPGGRLNVDQHRPSRDGAAVQQPRRHPRHDGG